MTTTEIANDTGAAVTEALGERFVSLTGRMVPYDTPTDVGFFTEEIQRGVFTDSIVRQPKVPLLLWHDARSFPIGHAVAWDDRPDGLHGVFKLNDSPEAQLTGKYARDEDLTGMSVGFGPVRSTWTYAAEWDPDSGPAHVTRHEARLDEVPITATPAYPSATIYSVEAVALDERATPHLDNYRLWMRQVGRQYA